MTKLVPVKLKDGTTIFVQSNESTALVEGGTIEEAASPRDALGRALDTGEQLSKSIVGFCGEIMGSLHGLRDAHLTKATLEFGINISIEGNVFIVKASGEATIKITAEWQLETGSEGK